MPVLQLLYFGGIYLLEVLQDTVPVLLVDFTSVFTIYQQFSFSTAFKNLIQHKPTPSLTFKI